MIKSQHEEGGGGADSPMTPDGRSPHGPGLTRPGGDPFSQPPFPPRPEGGMPGSDPYSHQPGTPRPGSVDGFHHPDGTRPPGAPFSRGPPHGRMGGPFGPKGPGGPGGPGMPHPGQDMGPSRGHTDFPPLPPNAVRSDDPYAKRQPTQQDPYLQMPMRVGGAPYPPPAPRLADPFGGGGPPTPRPQLMDQSPTTPTDPHGLPPRPHSQDPFGQPPGTPRPMTADPYAHPPGTPRPSPSDPYAQMPGTPRPMPPDHFPQPPGTPRSMPSDPYAQPPGTPRPGMPSDPYAQPPGTPRPPQDPTVDGNLQQILSGSRQKFMEERTENGGVSVMAVVALKTLSFVTHFLLLPLWGVNKCENISMSF